MIRILSKVVKNLNNISWLFIISCTLISLNSSAAFNLKIEFTPKFKQPSTLSIEQREEGVLMKIVTEELGDSAYLNSAAVKDIQAFFDNNVLITDTSRSILEIHAKGVFTEDGVKRTFEFNPPKKGAKEHKLIELLWTIMYTLIDDNETVNYLEDVEQQYDFGLGIKKLNEDPLTYKLYGQFTAREANEFYQFLDRLPRDKPVYMDMSNFESMGRLFNPTLKNFSEENSEVYWINCNNAARIQLYNAKVPYDRVILLKDK